MEDLAFDHANREVLRLSANREDEASHGKARAAMSELMEMLS